MSTFPRITRRLQPCAKKWATTALRTCSSYGDSVTYSGGHANVGQGGFYGSGGSRVITKGPEHHKAAVANAADVNELVKVMATVENYESELLKLGNEVCSRSIELRSLLKKTITNPQVRAILSRLEIKGEPVWGLSTKEREIVKEVRRRYHA